MAQGGWVPKLPRSAWILLGGDALSAIGSGLTLPFLLIYLHQARGLSLSMAGAAVSVEAMAGFVGNPLGGALADRFGARRAVALGLVVAGAGTLSLAGVEHAWQAFASCALTGLGIAVVWPAQDSLLAVVVAPEQRSSVFSVRHATLNAGLGVGGLMAAALVGDGSSTSAFVRLYVIDSLTFLAFIPLLWTVHEYAGVADEDEVVAEATSPSGWRTVFADAAFRRIWLLTALLVAVGYAQFNSTFPAFASRPSGIEPGSVGIPFAVNTVGVVAFQLVALRLMTGRKRSTGVLIAGSFWALAWAVAVVGGAAGGGAAAVAVFSLAALVFAVGETFLTPTLAPIVNDLASDDLRGRYNGLYVLAWTTGFALGPVVGGVFLDAGVESMFFVGLACICALLGWWGRGIGRRIPAELDLVSA